jgi:two-component system nitrate/nitrite response regulator NarL
MATILLVLRLHLLRDAVHLLLTDAGFSIVGEASDLDGALVELAVHPPRLNLVIVDVACCNVGPDAIGRIRQAAGDARIVILTDEADLHRISNDHVVAANGILTFDLSQEAMIRALRLIQMGERVIPGELVRSLPTRGTAETVATMPGCRAGGRKLSPRETDMLRNLLHGNSNKLIARRLGITEATVKVHLKGLMRKIDVANRTQAALWAQNNGFADP